MSMHTSDIDDDEDTTGADRGDVVDAAVANVDKVIDDLDKGDDKADDKADSEGVDKGAQRRDEKGKFAKADDKDDDNGDDKGDDKDDDKDDDKGDDIPNAAVRLDRMREQRDRERAEKLALAARIEALEKGAKPPEKQPTQEEKINAELEELYEKVEMLRADGEHKEAAKLQRQIDTKNRELVILEAKHISNETTTEAAENAKYDALLDQFEAEIPQLNPKHEDFDPKAVKALEFYVEAHEKMGMPASRALQMARNVVFGAAKAPEKKDDKKPDDKKPEKKTDLDKVADTQRRQPPDPSNKGTDKDDVTLDPDKMSDEEWAAVPKAKRAAMRGDNG